MLAASLKTFIDAMASVRKRRNWKFAYHAAWPLRWIRNRFEPIGPTAECADCRTTDNLRLISHVAQRREFPLTLFEPAASRVSSHTTDACGRFFVDDRMGGPTTKAGVSGLNKVLTGAVGITKAALHVDRADEVVIGNRPSLCAACPNANAGSSKTSQ